MPARFAPPRLRPQAGAVLAPLLAVVLAAGASAGAAVARADTDRPTQFMDLVRGSDVVALVQVRQAPPEAAAWSIEVLRGYRGATPGILDIEPAPADPEFLPGERWLILTSSLETLDVRAGLVAFRVDEDGDLETMADVVAAPTSLAALDELLGPGIPAATDPPPAAAGAAEDPAASLRDALPAIALRFVLAVLAVFLAAAALARRALARQGRR